MIAALVLVLCSSCIQIDNQDELSKLAQQLKDKETQKRIEAAEAILKLGDKASPIVKEVLEAYVDEQDMSVHSPLFDALFVNGKASVEAMTDYACDRTRRASKRILVIRGLRHFSGHEEFISQRLAPCLLDPDKKLTRYAALTIARGNPNDSKSIEILLEHIRSTATIDDKRQRIIEQTEAAMVLAMSKEHKAISATILFDWLHNVPDKEKPTIADFLGAEQCMYALFFTGKEVQKDLKFLSARFEKTRFVEDLSADEYTFNLTLSSLILATDSKHVAARQYLVKNLSHLKAELQGKYGLLYIHAVGELGKEGEPALERLKAIAESSDAEQREAAKRAITRIRGD